jgi:Rrf2 family nitric oxide-sensitive transcriptional repressor
MRLTTRTNLAMRSLMFCAVNPGITVRKSDIASACNASLNHLGLVINLLGQNGFIETSRGRHGGVRLARSAQDISVGAVARVLESDVPFAECFNAQENTCPLTASCKLRGALRHALDAFYASLDEVTLADLTEGNNGLHRLLSLEKMAA